MLHDNLINIAEKLMNMARCSTVEARSIYYKVQLGLVDWTFEMVFESDVRPPLCFVKLQVAHQSTRVTGANLVSLVRNGLSAAIRLAQRCRKVGLVDFGESEATIAYIGKAVTDMTKKGKKVNTTV